MESQTLGARLSSKTNLMEQKWLVWRYERLQEGVRKLLKKIEEDLEEGFVGSLKYATYDMFDFSSPYPTSKKVSAYTVADLYPSEIRIINNQLKSEGLFIEQRWLTLQVVPLRSFPNLRSFVRKWFNVFFGP